MIGTFNIKLHAANPNLPLPRLFAFVGSPSNVRIVDAPRKIGSWSLTKVYLLANYPDNTSRSVEATLDGGCWHATLPACSVVGTSAVGFRVTADGVSEDGTTAVTGYVLGAGDLEILSTDGTVTVGETTYYVHLVDTQPTAPKKGDLCNLNGSWKIYTGSAWESLGGGTGDVCHSDFTDTAALPDRYTLADVKEKVNTVLSILKGSTISLIALISTPFAPFCAASLVTLCASAAIETQTAQLGSLYNDALVVTNVTGTATDGEAVTNIVDGIVSSSNLVSVAYVGGEFLSIHGGTATRASGSDNGVSYTLQGGRYIPTSEGAGVGGAGASLSIGGGGDTDVGTGGTGASLTLSRGGNGDFLSGTAPLYNSAKLEIGGHGESVYSEIQANGSLTIQHTGTSSETLTERIVRDAAVSESISATTEYLTNDYIRAENAAFSNEVVKAAGSRVTLPTYDFQSGTNFTLRLYAVLTNIIDRMGGSITNAPSFD